MALLMYLFNINSIKSTSNCTHKEKRTMETDNHLLNSRSDRQISITEQSKLCFSITTNQKKSKNTWKTVRRWMDLALANKMRKITHKWVERTIANTIKWTKRKLLFLFCYQIKCNSFNLVDWRANDRFSTHYPLQFVHGTETTANKNL